MSPADIERINRAEAFAREAHKDQVRKYNGEPYTNHLANVAQLVADNLGGEEQIMAAWLHDTIEDTPIGYVDLRWKFGHQVADIVNELTNVYTRKRWGHLNRAQRKLLEAERLSGISDAAQTIKYADFLDNGRDLIRQDPKFAQVFLIEALHAIMMMREGNTDLRFQAQEELFKGLEKIHEHHRF